MAEVTPGVSPGFEWRVTPAGRVLVCTALASIAPHLFSSRDASPPGRHAPDYGAMAASLSVDVTQVVQTRQVHGRGVVVVREGERPDPAVEADAIVSVDPTRAVSVRVADCVPILLADRHGRVVAAVHAGWRGTSAGVAAAAVRAIEALGVPAGDLLAAVGPSIGPCCYQVDATVRDDFLARHLLADHWFTADGPDRWRLDLQRANHAQLEACGLRATDIHHASACTADAPILWYSHRRQGAAAGRMIAAIRLNAE
jgi:YfiH family protein